MNYQESENIEDRLRVLFVEDDSIDRIAFRRFVRNQKLNYEVTEASSVNEAVVALDNYEFDIVLCDFNLGGGTSFEFFDMMVNVPYILVTGIGDQKTAVKAMKSGASDYILKDNHGNHLQTIPLTIENALKRKKAEIELEQYRANLEQLVKIRTSELEKEIEERKKTETRLTESEEKYRLLMETMNDGLLILDHDENITYSNIRMGELLGVRAIELIGRNIEEFVDHLEFPESDVTTLSLADSGKSVEIAWGTNDEEKIHTIVSRQPMFDGARNHIGSFAVVTDISFIKKAEQKIRRLNAELEQKVYDRTSQLEDALVELRFENEERKRTQEKLVGLNSELSDSQNKLQREALRLVDLNAKLKESESQLIELNASKDKFFSIIAHDLKGPFSGFLGLSELIADEFENLDKDDIAKMAKSLNNGAKQLFILLENLLEWSRIQRGQIDYSPEKLDVFRTAAANIELIRNTAERKDIIIMNKIKSVNNVRADRNMLNTIFRNLLSNAVKFSEHGNVIVVNAVNKDDNFVEISVRDQGVGMEPEILEKIFRIDTKHTTVGTDREKGTGLGLLLCKELTEKHGGSILAESKIGQGSMFKFTMPSK